MNNHFFLQRLLGVSLFLLPGMVKPLEIFNDTTQTLRFSLFAGYRSIRGNKTRIQPALVFSGILRPQEAVKAELEYIKEHDERDEVGPVFWGPLVWFCKSQESCGDSLSRDMSIIREYVEIYDEQHDMWKPIRVAFEPFSDHLMFKESRLVFNKIEDPRDGWYLRTVLRIR